MARKQYQDATSNVGGMIANGKLQVVGGPVALGPHQGQGGPAGGQGLDHTQGHLGHKHISYLWFGV